MESLILTILVLQQIKLNISLQQLQNLKVLSSPLVSHRDVVSFSNEPILGVPWESFFHVVVDTHVCLFFPDGDFGLHEEEIDIVGWSGYGNFNSGMDTTISFYDEDSKPPIQVTVVPTYNDPLPPKFVIQPGKHDPTKEVNQIKTNPISPCFLLRNPRPFFFFRQ